MVHGLMGKGESERLRREQRLQAALRQNLKRRKDQARQRERVTGRDSDAEPHEPREPQAETPEDG